jgi:hypothetical protein
MWSQEIEEINNNMHEFDLYSKLSIFVLIMLLRQRGIQLRKTKMEARISLEYQ